MSDHPQSSKRKKSRIKRIRSKFKDRIRGTVSSVPWLGKWIKVARAKHSGLSPDENIHLSHLPPASMTPRARSIQSKLVAASEKYRKDNP